MFIVLAVLLSAVALFAVAYPILQRASSPRPTAASAQETLEELLAQREAAFQALRELHFDHRVGKITDEDFAAFEANLKLHAAETLRALDRWEAEADAQLEGLISRELRRRRAALGPTGRRCPACGRPAEPEDKFCAGCGAALPVSAPPPTALACPACGHDYQPGDRFCAGCGAALS
ncbi:MAG: zinc ribbon domain-containing protein [Anaerolineae bacterium]|nr:zinc ribbon domain-containing protein [Anaerolineae bacterium]